MSEQPAKVRLVRCPKCENLLPELPDYSVYQCGGCGTVLRGTLSLSVFFFPFVWFPRKFVNDFLYDLCFVRLC